MHTNPIVTFTLPNGKSGTINFAPLKKLLEESFKIPSDVFVNQVSNDLLSLPEIKDDPKDLVGTNQRLQARLLFSNSWIEFAKSITAVEED